MARVTVEDCLENVENRFQLVLLAAKRARQLMRGQPAKVEWNNDKATVVALREIAAGYVGANLLLEDTGEEPSSAPFSLPDDDSASMTQTVIPTVQADHHE